MAMRTSWVEEREKEWERRLQRRRTCWGSDEEGMGVGS